MNLSHFDLDFATPWAHETILLVEAAKKFAETDNIVDAALLIPQIEELIKMGVRPDAWGADGQSALH